MMIVGAVMSTIVIIFVTTTMMRKKKNRPPGPRGLPVVGNLFELKRSKVGILIYLQQLSECYGPLVYLRYGSTPTLVVSSAKVAKQILKTQDLSFCSRPAVVGQQKLSYGGVDMAFSPYNNHWKEVRKMCMLHLFSPKQVLSFRPIREQQVGLMMEKIISNINNNNNNDNVINLSAMAMSLASNIICGVAFGRTYDDGEYQKKRLDSLVLEAQALMVSFYFSDHFPRLTWVLDKLSGLLGRLDRNFREMDALYQQLIDDHLRSADRHHRDRDDVIDLMINLRRRSPDSVTWDQIKALLMNLYVAGTDTVAAAVVWTMTALMLRPEIMKKTQTHIREAMKGKQQRRQQQMMMINEDDIAILPYLKAVVMESLRLYPPAPLLYRRPSITTTVEGYEIEAGSTFIINAWGIARDPETWENPEEFVPERFMKNEEYDDDIINGYMMEDLWMLPFGGGRRGCPGMGMGMSSIHLTLANLLYSFDWASASNNNNNNNNNIIDTQALPGLTMHKKNPLLLLPTIHNHLIIPSSPI
ncbi:hypothetical protein C2S53_013505 [Perilla frutescens var. hirtella]|uniref:Cytochrome P450 n=1 Tax=Perilla frutescens var. hirtella TaxID=608512 RepID=A0AAD4P6P8_PERFH|nr:hypothetical protein C2S53_013505 [Perilla frutescens var. hirtella]